MIEAGRCDVVPVIYLDHNASAPCSDAARAAVTDLLADGWANPSSIHLRGQRARAVIEDARERVAEAIGAEPGGPVNQRSVLGRPLHRPSAPSLGFW